MSAYPRSIPSWRNIPIDELELSVRASNSLSKHGIHTAGDLADLTDNQLKEMKGLGHRTILELREAIADISGQRYMELKEKDFHNWCDRNRAVLDRLRAGEMAIVPNLVGALQ